MGLSLNYVSIDCYVVIGDVVSIIKFDSFRGS